MGKVISYRHEHKPLPNELLLMYRQRSGMTQRQLAAQLGLKSERMVQKWESGYTLPTASRLQSLIELYFNCGILVVGKETAEARELWRTVKDMFEQNSTTYETYPIFDEGWFAQLTTKSSIQPDAAITAVDLPSNIPISKDQEKERNYPTFLPAPPNHLIGQEEELRVVHKDSQADAGGAVDNYPHNLPQTLQPLVGRERELAQLTNLLLQPRPRLLTLTGAGGSGKTSLAMAVGKALLPSFSEGVYLVKLESVTTRESLLGEMAATFKVNERPGQDLGQSLKQFLNGKDLLLILDNFEQLVIYAEVLSELLHGTDRVKLVVTSRIPLQLSFEHEFPVGSLELPAPDWLTNPPLNPAELATAYAGVALFVMRTQALKPDFSLSGENVEPLVAICQRLDGMPLALELAAARMRTFSPAKLLERLSLQVLTGGARDLPARQKTLRDTIGWSYDLLTPAEQRLLAHLAIFVGGCTLEAAETVCGGPDQSELAVFEGIASLVTKNLLKVWEGVDGQTRYGMLVTIREFALEKLAESGEFAELEQRFIAYYLGLTTQHELIISDPNPQEVAWLQEVQSEYINLRAVFSQALATGQAGAALQLSVTLAEYFDNESTPSEGLNLVEQALALVAAAGGPAQLNKKLVAAALSWAGTFNRNLGDTAMACRQMEAAVALQREVGDTPGLINSLCSLRGFALYRGDYAKAEEYQAESLPLSRKLSEDGRINSIWPYLGMVARDWGKYDEARLWFEESLVRSRACDHKLAMAIFLGELGELDQFQGKYGESRAKQEEALLLHRELKVNWGIVLALNNLGIVLLNQGEYAQARQYSMESLALSRRLVYGHLIAESLCSLGTVALCEHNYQEARRCLEESLDILRKRDDEHFLEPMLPVLGVVAANQGEDEAARQYFMENLAFNRRAGEWGNKLYLSHALSGLAELWLKQGLKAGQKEGSYPSNYLEEVVRLSGAIRAILLSRRLVMYRPFAESYESNLKLARANLAKATFETVFREGQAMRTAEAIAYALGE